MNKDIIKNSKYINILLFVIITIAILFQICFFFKTMNPEINSNPYLHTTKIAIAIFISSFIFFCKNKYWPIYLSIFINLWGMSNLIYYRANGILIDAYSITMIGNMDGFWSSVPFYIELSDFICFLATIIITISCILLKNDKKSYILGILCLFLSITVHIYACENKMKRDNPTHEIFDSIKGYNPFSLNNDLWIMNWDCFHPSYSQELSILHYFIYCSNYFIQRIMFQQEYQLSDNEINQAQQFIFPYLQEYRPSTPLIIILVESFENWVITSETTPNIYRFINDNEDILYASKIKSQTRGGTSADGQMIVNTGLLPIKEGAVCYRFSNNTFPALSKLYQSSCNIIPGNQSIWNQRYMNIAYNIKDSYTIKTKDVSVGEDQIIFQKYSKIYDKYEYSMILTISTHTPFESISEKSSLVLPGDMPKDMANYMKSFHYTDSCMQYVLDNIQTDSILKNSTIVITSDHSIFPQIKREEFDKYCRENDLAYKVTENYCPLIIYSPNIKEKIIVDELAYQMDIYPTILNLIGCENYYFKGFGINLLNKELYDNRPITEEEAYDLSDKIIQSNYFKKIENNVNEK